MAEFYKHSKTKNIICVYKFGGSTLVVVANTLDGDVVWTPNVDFRITTFETVWTSQSNYCSSARIALE